jgi:RNA polymerase sigma factor (sigma-70 family)
LGRAKREANDPARPSDNAGVPHRTNQPELHQLLARGVWTRKLARSLVPQAAEADDLLQDAWLVSAGSPGGTERTDRPWLAGVLRVLGQRRAREAGRRRQRELESARVPAVVADPRPDTLVEQVETQRLLAEALLALGEPYRTTLLLRYYEDVSSAEIARRTGVPEGTVRWRLKEGLERLRAELDRCYGDRKAWALALFRFGAKPASSLAPRWIAIGVGVLTASALVWVTGSPARSIRQREPAALAPRATAAVVDPLSSPTSTRTSTPASPRKDHAMNPKLAALALAAGLATYPPSGTAIAAPTEIPASPQPRFWVPLGVGPIKGPASAKVTILVFHDYQCAFCATGSRTMDRLVAAHPQDVRLQVIHRPLKHHNKAPLAARAALAANQQGKFWPMHDRLVASANALEPADLEAHARAVGLDLARFRADLAGATVLSQFDAEEANAESVQVTATPSYFFNGRVVGGARPLGEFEKILAEEIAYADAVLAAGVPPQELYNTVIKRGATELPTAVDFDRGGARVQPARKKCVAGKEKLARGLEGLIIYPVSGNLSQAPEGVTPAQMKIAFCLMDALKNVLGAWRL